jgi:hypothetical protein
MASNLVLPILIFLLGLIIVTLTVFSALSTFVLPRANRSQLNRLVFGLLRRMIALSLRFTKTFRQRDALMAYYAPLGLLALVPTWYVLILLGYSCMYWALGVGNWLDVFRLSGSSLFTLGFANAEGFWVAALEFSEAMLGLIMVALLMAYLPTMYAAFARREQTVNLMDVRAGNPPSAIEMLQRFQRNHGLERLNDYWQTWETWFADIEESHTTLPALVFFRSPRPENSWVLSAGAALDAASLTLSSVEIPYETNAALCIRAGFLALRRIADYFDIPHPPDPRYPNDSISVTQAEFEDALNRLAASGLPLKQDRDQMWQDFAGWRVNYDRVLLALCTLTMAPQAPWSSDRAPRLRLPPLFLFRNQRARFSSKTAKREP